MYNDSTPNNKRNLWCNFDSEYDFIFDELHQHLSSSKFFSDKKSMPSNVIFNSETAKKITIKELKEVNEKMKEWDREERKLSRRKRRIKEHLRFDKMKRNKKKKIKISTEKRLKYISKKEKKDIMLKDVKISPFNIGAPKSTIFSKKKKTNKIFSWEKVKKEETAQ